MAKFHANITLLVNQFEADSLAQAQEVVDVYIDELTNVGGGLNWEEVEVTVVEETD